MTNSNWQTKEVIPSAVHHSARVGQQPVMVAVVGATASGKSDLALELAGQLGGEIVNTDAMAVYRGMDIGTAKTPLAQRRGVPHHLLDLLEVTEPLSVGEFQGWARAAVREIRGREAYPILVGGSALYTRAILDRFDFPGTDPDVRASLETELAERGVAELYARLQRVDPVAAEQIRPENGRRIVRALEVIELTGQPFAAQLPTLEYADPVTIQIGVNIDRQTLHARIAARVEQMFADGLVEEVAGLLERGLTDGRTAATAIGYREAAAHLAGELNLAEAVERTIIATRKFARRQDSWFRKDPRIHWVEWDDVSRVERALSVVSEFSARMVT